MIARIVTYIVIAALAAFVIFTTFFLDQGGGKAEPTDGVVSVHNLSLDPDMYRGKTVTTEGTLNYSDATQQYQVVDADVAVVINGYELATLHSLTGQPVLVTGRFDFDEGTGIFIEAETIEVKD
jgi:hypothetical protein